MSILESRLNRGFEALEEGDLDTARARLEEVAFSPGKTAPVRGLPDTARRKFFALRNKITEHERIPEEELVFDEPEYDEEEQALVDAGYELDAGCACQSTTSQCACQNSTEAHLVASLETPLETTSDGFYKVDSTSHIDIHTTHQQTRTVAIDGDEFRDTLSTVETRTTSVYLEKQDTVPGYIQDEIGFTVVDERDWSECHVEEINIVRTTLVYKDGSEETHETVLLDSEE